MMQAYKYKSRLQSGSDFGVLASYALRVFVDPRSPPFSLELPLVQSPLLLLQCRRTINSNCRVPRVPLVYRLRQGVYILRQEVYRLRQGVYRLRQGVYRLRQGVYRFRKRAMEMMSQRNLKENIYALDSRLFLLKNVSINLKRMKQKKGPAYS